MRPRGGGLGVLGGDRYKAGSHIGTSKYFSLEVFEGVKLSPVELSSVDRCSSSPSSWLPICTPSKEEANGRSAVLSAYTIIHAVISAKSDPPTLKRCIMQPSIPTPSKASLPLATQNGALDAVTKPGIAAVTQNKTIALDIIKHAERRILFW